MNKILSLLFVFLNTSHAIAQSREIGVHIGTGWADNTATFDVVERNVNRASGIFGITVGLHFVNPIKGKWATVSELNYDRRGNSRLTFRNYYNNITLAPAIFRFQSDKHHERYGINPYIQSGPYLSKLVSHELDGFYSTRGIFMPETGPSRNWDCGLISAVGFKWQNRFSTVVNFELRFVNGIVNLFPDTAGVASKRYTFNALFVGSFSKKI